MATTVFTAAQLEAIYALQGRYDLLTSAAQCRFRLQGSGLCFSVTGTDCTLLGAFGGANPFAYYLDDVLQTAPTYSAGQIPLFSGLSDTTRKVELRLAAAFSRSTSHYLTASGAVSVTGAAPAIGRVSTRGPQIHRGDYRSCFTTYPETIANSPGFPAIGTCICPPVPPLATGGTQGNAMRVRGRADSVLALVDTSGAARPFALAKDGVIVARTSVTASGYTWAQVGGTGLDDGAEHEWEVIAGVASGLDALQLGGAFAAISATAPVRRTLIVCEGDSITASVSGGSGPGITDTGGDGTLAYPVVLGKLCGKDGIAIGRSGTTSQVGAEQVVNDLRTALGTGNEVSHVVLFHGRNDDGTQTQAYFATMIARILALPEFRGKIVVVTNPQIGAFNGATATAVNQAKRNAVAAAASSRVVLVDGATWTDVTAADGTHYGVEGHALFAQRIYASGAMADIPSGGGGGGTGFVCGSMRMGF